MLYIVILQDSEPLRKRLMHHGVRIGSDSVLRQRSKSYVNSILFLKYINNIFVSYLNDGQETEKFEACEACEACEAVLLMHNCSSHMPDNVIAILIREQMRILIFTIHIIQIFKMFDVVLFGALKKYATGLEKLDEESRATAFILKIYRNFKEMMVEINIWKAFAVIELTHDIDQILYGLLFDKEKF
jgi:hypothetical protein